MIKVGDVISYWDMCKEEGSMIQRGMNFRLRNKASVVLMSLRRGAPYADRVEENGRVLIYEGHDIPQKKGGPDPKSVNQEKYTPGGSFTQNGLFNDAATKYKKGRSEPELVKVYEKIKSGIWVYNGIFRLIDSWQATSNSRKA